MRIVSGGQTGVDRAALDVALALGVACGGWCPAGRWAEDGPIPARYPLVAADSADPAVRTALNVRDSDATLVLADGAPRGGTAETVAAAERLGRLLLVLDLAAAPEPEIVQRWIARERIGTLNVAGPRESEAPGIQQRAADFLRRALSERTVTTPRAGQGREGAA